MKKITEPGSEVENVENETSEDLEKEEFPTIEKIAQLANSGHLSDEFSNSEIEMEIASINEGMDRVKVIWLNRNTQNEVRIDFMPKDSTKVFRVAVEGKANKFHSETGVKLGMTIDELNSANRKPVDFYGFEWDFSGAVKFNNGQLENEKIRVYVKTDKNYGNQFIGDTPHTFEEAKAAKLELYVHKIIFEPSKSTKL
ncbi:hypothetical protein [Aequorivita aurantiaca]|nr:hypothetical protein [Aequorivita aurantiaca]